MFNISKQGSSLLITSNDNSQFPWKDGQMSLPMNSVVYVIDESDYIAFRSASNNDILFTALIDEIQINGTNVTKDDFILQFDNVANSAGGGGGSASAGVNSINGFQGDLTLKSINGQSLIGSGDIEISGGSTAGVSAINIGEEVQDWTQKTGVVSFFTKFYDGSYDVNINGTSFYGLKPIDDSIVLENAGYTANGNFRCGVKVNEDNFKTINGESIFGTGDIKIEGGSDLISIDANNSSYSLNVGSGNTGDLYGTILIGRNIVNNYNAAVLIGNNVTNTVGDRNNMVVNICNSLMADSSGNMYFWKNGKVEKLADYAVYKEWSGTQAEYDALGTYDDNTIYNIIEG